MRVILLAALACAAVAIPHAHAGCVDEFGEPRYQMPSPVYVDEAGRVVVDPNAVTFVAGRTTGETFEFVACVV